MFSQIGNKMAKHKGKMKISITIHQKTVLST